jgi:hypothetical protein
MRETIADKKEEIGMKIWCPETEKFQYINVCEKKCKKKYRCLAFMDYVAPKLF